MRPAAKIWFGRIGRLLFPPKCAACGQRIDWFPDGGSALCPKCLSDWENEEKETCHVCSRPVSECVCMTELMENAKCAAFCKAVYYRKGKAGAAQNRVIYRIKHRSVKRISDFLAERVTPSVTRVLRENGVETRDTVVIYLPRTASAKARFGTDQAEEFAESLSEKLAIPALPALTRSRRADETQKKLGAEQRVKNAKRAFRLRDGAAGAIRGKTVLLVDDIVTTGASMAACAALLRRAGAAKIVCVAPASDDRNVDRSDKSRKAGTAAVTVTPDAEPAAGDPEPISG